MERDGPMSGLFPNPFHGRLVLLLSLVGLMVGLLTARLATLSLARGGELRAQAEGVLLRKQWIPASRGRIIDRKGRVLAQDRPTYNVMVDYDVFARVEAVKGDPSGRMTTRWARQQAAKWARRLTGYRWMDLSKEEQAERRAAILPIFEAHLDKAWGELARMAGVPREEIESRKNEIIEKVERTHGLFVDWRLAVAVKDLLATGVKPTPEQEEAIRKVRADEPLTPAELKLIGAKNAQGPIAEQESEHIILAKVSDEVGFACILLSQEEEEITLPAFDAGTGDAQFSTVTVDRFPGMVVEDAGAREYPFENLTVEVDKSTFPSTLRSSEKQVVKVEGVACHILGRMRDTVYATDQENRQQYLDENPAYAQRACLNPDAPKPSDRNDRGSYRNRDRVGAAGIEFSQENVLRGLRGVKSQRLDTGDEAAFAPEDGKNLYLTLDIALQAKIQAIMAPEVGLAKVQEWQLSKDPAQRSPTQKPGDPLYGAAVVEDVDSGEILAMVSTPTYTREQLQDNPKSIYGDDPDTIVAMPGVNKAIARAYAPGSIVKAILLSEAESRGFMPVGHTIECTGHLFPDRKDAFRCWIYKQTQHTTQTTHSEVLGGPLTGPQALMVSCNIYFFTVGKLLGIDGILEAYKDFGVGTKYNLGVGYEQAGQAGRRAPVSSNKDADKPKDTPAVLMNMYDAIQMGIGQGPVTWTPVHAADAYATLARGGVRVAPRVIRNGAHSEPVDLHLKPESIVEAMEGLKLSVNDHRGTGNHINYATGPEDTFDVKGVTVWGKTGTATASPIVFDPDGDGPLPGETLESGDHSWFVVLVGKDRPQYAISVVIDFGGSGGKVSGPIVNQIIHALQDEGYLEGKPLSEGAQP